MSAVKLVKGKSLENIFKNFKLEYDWKEVFDFLAKIPVTKHYKLKWGKPNADKIKKFLCEERDFKVERVMAALEKIK